MATESKSAAFSRWYTCLCSLRPHAYLLILLGIDDLFLRVHVCNVPLSLERLSIQHCPLVYTMYSSLGELLYFC